MVGQNHFGQNYGNGATTVVREVRRGNRLPTLHLIFPRFSLNPVPGQ